MRKAPKINKESFVRYLKLTLVKSHKIILYTVTGHNFWKLSWWESLERSLSLNLGCSTGQICSSSCSFQLWIELLPVLLCGPVVIERSHNMVRASWLDKCPRSRSQRRDRCRNRPDNRSYPTPIQSRFSWVTYIIGRPIPVESYMQCARIIVPMKSTDILPLSTTQIHANKIYD